MNKGFEYENMILNLMKENNFISNKYLHQNSAGCDNTQPDLVIRLKGEDVNIELKQNIKSQAGGTSIRYNHDNFSLVKDIENINKTNLISMLESKKDHIDNFLTFHNASSVPFTTTKEMWNRSVEKGLLRKINASIKCDTKFIEEHYTSKNTYYINIGGKGLYYMKKDILNLGVPRLNCDVSLEIRLTRNGSKLNAKGIRVCSGALRIQSRMKNLKQSNCSLENIDSIAMFN